MRRLLALIAFAPLLALSAAEIRVGDAATLNEAVRTAKPGDEIVLAAGEWRDADLRFQAEGTAGKPITMRAESPGKTILTGKSRLRLAGQHLVVSGLWFRNPEDLEVIEFRLDSKTHASNCRLTDCAITSDEGKGGKKPKEGRWLNLYGSNNRVDHCLIQGKTNRGTTVVVWLGLTPQGGHRIDNNYFGPRPMLGQNGGETIRIGDSKTSMSDGNCIVERNLFQQCNGEGEIISNKSCGNTYRQNLFMECEGALTLRHGNRCLVEGNWFIGNQKRLTGGVRIIGEDHRVVNNYLENLAGDDFRSGITLMNAIPNSPLNGYYQVKRALVAFNTLVNCKVPMAVGMSNDKECTLAPVECVIANNIIQAPKAKKAIDVRVPDAVIEWRGNLVSAMELGVPETKGITMRSAELAESKTGMWRPGADSPVQGAASQVKPAVTKDIEGQARGDALDVGCDQGGSGAVTIKMVTRAEVGPSWMK